MPTTAIVNSPKFLDHVTGSGHPEQPKRISAVMAELESTGTLEQLLTLAPRCCTKDQMQAVHPSSYLDAAEADISAGRSQLSTGDTSVCRDSWNVASLAAGAGLVAVDAVMEGRANNAFCAVRPPGHHATRNVGMGFCVMSNIAIAARYAQQQHGIGKVLIVDWDVHHGNGTQDVFYDDDSVLFFSTHQSPWYPGTGAASETGQGAGIGTTINVPLPAHTEADTIMSAFEQRLLPAAQEFRPELVLISAGFDSRRGDPLGNFLLEDEHFEQLTQMVRELADEHCDGRIVSLLEGGYALDGLAKAATAHVRALLRA